MKLEEGLDLFRESMLIKFQLREDKHGERSVALVGDTLLQEEGAGEKLMHHLGLEVVELQIAKNDSESMDEAVDVANMAFLLWWRHLGANRGKQEQTGANSR